MSVPPATGVRLSGREMAWVGRASNVVSDGQLRIGIIIEASSGEDGNALPFRPRCRSTTESVVLAHAHGVVVGQQRAGQRR